MAFNIASPFLGLTYSIQYHEFSVHLQVHSCAGDLLPTLVKMELTFAEQAYQRIYLDFDDGVPTQPQRLDSLNYKANGNGFIKEITYRKAVRFSITEKCNYHCFFCHEEGMEMEIKREAVNHERFFEIIDQLAELGYDDFTFTGGEPLLNWRGVNACLDYMEQIGYQPEVTIVTNGERINQRIIDRLIAYPGKVRFNLSLHSLIDDEYLHIVHRKKKPGKGSDDLLNNIKQKIVLIHQAGIPFKLNIVLLKGVNTSKASLEAILEYAADHGATSVKFLELLITEELRNFYEYFYTLAAVKESLKQDLTLLWQNQKKDVFQYKNSQLEVELQHCPCARGCNACFLNRGVTFTAEMKFFPCFLHPEHNYSLTATNLAECIEKGDQYIDGMAKYYQDNSPILIKEAYSTKQESAYYYQIAQDDIERVAALSQSRLGRVREFNEQYYIQPNQADQIFCKLATNSYDQTALEIQQNITISEDGKHHTEFLHDGICIQDRARYEHSMQEKGYKPGLTLDWKIDYFVAKEDEFSISINQQTGVVLLRTLKPFEQLTVPVQRIEQPIPQFIASIINADLTEHKELA